MDHLPQIWGGIECTINRVEDHYLDQLALADYYNKPEYLDAIIATGITTLRFPVLWEKHQPGINNKIDWSWATSQLNRLRENNITPIVGLLHHGSGPIFTDLLQNDFPEKFAAYAGEVARQFPWVMHYTPVNEPLTTARFSGLYGLWYPHKNNDVSFIKILLNELKGIVLAMQEIRKINPAARLIQTEDLAKTYSTALLTYQAAFENNRRWLTYDILTGNFTTEHPLWNYFMRLGIAQETMEFFTDHPCIPDVIGVNYYLTSERFLDEDIQNYSSETHGGNGIHQYADVEAVRIDIKEPHGAEVLLKEIWERYKLPLAVTEVHLHCSREEQLRWLQTMYDTAVKLRENNVDIIAITVWSMLGSFGWNKLLTCFDCEYETGAFDISSDYPRSTALAELIKNIITKKERKEYLLKPEGWWQRDSRYFNSPGINSKIKSTLPEQPLIIIGKTGTLGKAFSKICKQRNLYHFLLGREDANICDFDSLEKMIRKFKPWAIVNAAGYVNVDLAEREKNICNKVNAFGTQKLAAICEMKKVKLVCFSSDLVFDGTKNEPYVESDIPKALNTYGHSKILAEKFLTKINPSSLIIRTSAFFGPWDEYNFISRTLSQLSEGKQIEAINDCTVSPTYIPHLVSAALNLLIDDEKGIWHLANKGSITWYDLATTAAVRAGFDESMIIPVSSNQISKAIRPAYSVLASDKYALMPSLENGLEEYFSHKYITV